MINGLEYVKETIDLRQSDILDNAFETNNLLLDDILLALGYNKRREPGVKAIYSGGVDWEVACGGENRFVVSVAGYGSNTTDNEQISTATDYAENGDFQFVMITDGKKIEVYTGGKCILSVPDIFEDTADEKLQCLTKNGWNPSKIIPQLEIDTDRLIKAIANTDVLELVARILEINPVSPNVISQIKDRINALISSVPTSNTEDTNKINELQQLVEELKAKAKKAESLELEVSNLKDELNTKSNDNSTIAADRDTLKSQVESLKTEIEGLTSKNNLLEQEKSKLAGQLSELSNDLADETELESLKEQLDAKDNQIAGLKSEISGYLSKISKLEAELLELQSTSDEFDSVDNE